MKLATRWGVLAVLFVQLVSLPASALETSPSDSSLIKVNGPFLITGYSFKGRSLQYVQIYNNSSSVASLNGWKVAVEYSGVKEIYKELSGTVAPSTYVTAADPVAVSNPTFLWSSVAPSDPNITNVSLIAPSESGFNDEIATPSITNSTVRIAGTPATFFFARNTSTTTGSYLSTFAAFIPSNSFTLASDTLYEPPSSPLLQIVEVYPDAPVCSPAENALTCSDYVKLQNVSAGPIDLSLFRLRTGSFGQTASSSNTVQLSGILASGEFQSFPLALNSSGSWTWLEDKYGTLRYDSTIISYPSSSNNDQQSWGYNEVSGNWQWTIYATPGNQANKFEEPLPVNSCDGLKINEIAANVETEDQFIELYNTTTSHIDLDRCVVQTNRSTTASYVLGSESLPPGNYKTVYVKYTPLTLTKTTSGTVYLLSSDMTTEVDAVSYNELAEDSSWILYNQAWLQTYALTPDSSNSLMEYLPCDAGYERNIETGRCNQIASEEELTDCGPGKYRSSETNRCRTLETSASSLAPCASNQYRNPETNRCRSLVSTASVLKPCASTQERNPVTNRCRLINSSSLKPCTAGQERNPTTNRCRNKGSNVVADFPVEAVAETGEATIGWWAFGGVGTLAAGYAGWEWRREVGSLIKKVIQFIPGSR